MLDLLIHAKTVAVSTGVVAIAEIGDKTQLFALVLALRYRQPWPIVWGILVATLANHALAGFVGASVAAALPEVWLRWGVAVSFLLVAAWTLVPDRLDPDEEPKGQSGRSAFMASLIGFFLIEMGDKTQIATVMLAISHHPLWAVVAGSTLGMMIANAPVAFAGTAFGDRIPLTATRIVAAGLFAILGLALLPVWG